MVGRGEGNNGGETLKLHHRKTTDLELADIQLRVAARDYAEHAHDPSDFEGVRAKHYAALLREAAEQYVAARVGTAETYLAAQEVSARWQVSALHGGAGAMGAGCEHPHTVREMTAKPRIPPTRARIRPSGKTVQESRRGQKKAGMPLDIPAANPIDNEVAAQTLTTLLA